MRVLKFGGSSLDGANRIDGVVEIVRRSARDQRLTVVVSALAGVTDLLESALDRALSGSPPANFESLTRRHVECLGEVAGEDERSYLSHLDATLDQLRRLLDGVGLLGECPVPTRDRILATGERLTAPLVATRLRRRGLPATAFDGASLIATGRSDAPVVDLDATRQRVEEVLAPRPVGEVAVVAGFVAADAAGRTTTLGRGASDYSATILAAALDAKAVEIWTDVDGVLSAEPRLVPEASSLPRLSYGEAADLAFFGARVLHPRTLEPLASRSIPLTIRSTRSPELPGTRVDGTDISNAGVRAVTGLPRVVRYRLRGVAGSGLRGDLAVLDQLTEPPLWVAWEAPERTLCLVVKEVEAPRVENFLDRQGRTGSTRCEELALVAALGGSGRQPWIMNQLLGVLAANQIAVRGLVLPGEAARMAAVLVDRLCLPRAIRRLHDQLVRELGNGRSPAAPSPLAPLPEGEGNQSRLRILAPGG